ICRREIMVYELNAMLNDILRYIPNIIKALILLLIAWGVSTLAKKLVNKLLLKLNVQKHLSKDTTEEGGGDGEENVKNIGQLVYFIVFLLFVPGILDTLEMESISIPITNMMQNLLGFIPRIIGAGIVLFVGYFIAKILRDLSFSLLKTVNIDKSYNKLNPELSSSPKAVIDAKQYTLADILSKTVFGLVLIPVITMALESLGIRTLTEPI